MRAVIYVHEPQEGAHLLGPPLRQAGWTLDERLRAPAPSDDSADLLVVMGGPMGVDEADRFPWLRTEIEVLRARLDADRPCLGVCLGAQLLAAAAKSRVSRGAAGFEVCVAPITLTDAARADPVFSAVPPVLEVVHWHGDTFEAVPGATLLAGTPRYAQQAFRLGRSYGLQFHPEVDAETFQRWVEESPELEKHGVDRAALLRDHPPRLREAEPHLAAFRERLVAELTALARARSPA